MSTAIAPTARILPCPSIGDGFYPYPTPLPSAMQPFAFRMADGTVLYEGRVAFTFASGYVSTGYAIFATNVGTRLMPLELRDFTATPLNPAESPMAVTPNGRPGFVRLYPGESGHSPEFTIGNRYTGIRWRVAGSNDTVEVPFMRPVVEPDLPTRPPGC